MTLFLIATPIGNLKDITFRAIETLNTCDYVLCEDTRHSHKLLEHYNIKKNLLSYHKFNEKGREKKIVQDLKLGKKIALISDAGMPIIADPGQNLVEKCHELNLQVIIIPGPSSLTSAIALSGFHSNPFQFFGFLPKKENEKKLALLDALFYLGITVAFESPLRILKTLQLLSKLYPECDVFIAKELTKKFEAYFKGKVKNVIEELKQKPLKGEIVLLIHPSKNFKNHWYNLSFKEHVSLLEKKYNLSPKEAIKLTAQLREVPKREIYNEVLSD